MAAPEVFGIIFKKHGIKLVSEPVDIKIFQRFFLSFMDKGFQITEKNMDRGQQSHVTERFEFQGDRIIKKFLFKVNTGYPVSVQHDPVFLLGIRPSGRQGHFPVKKNIVVGGGTLFGEHFFPPFVDFGDFGEKTVSAHIHPVAVVVYRFGYAAHGFAFFKYNHFIIIIHVRAAGLSVR